VRRSGRHLLDLALVLDPGESLERSHESLSRPRPPIKAQFAHADVVCTWSPAPISTDDLAAMAPGGRTPRFRARTTSACSKKTARTMELHLEMAESLPLGEAHRRASP